MRLTSNDRYRMSPGQGPGIMHIIDRRWPFDKGLCHAFPPARKRFKKGQDYADLNSGKRIQKRAFRARRK